MRKFRLDSASAKDAIAAAVTAGSICAYGRKGNAKGPAVLRRLRAERLLLHWWAVGHDPRRALDRCEDCWEPGCGVVKTTHPGHWESYDDIEVCQLCKGTGRAPVSEWRKL